jgi:integrase
MVSLHRNSSSVPKLVHNQASGRGVVRLNGRDVYCGKFGTAECEARYHQVIAEWLAAGRRGVPSSNPQGVEGDGASSDLTVNELAEAYLDFADRYYVKGGELTSEPGNIRLAIRPLRQLYGLTPAREFGPLRLEAVRQAMVDAGLCRNEVNRRVRLIVRAFKWAASEELISASVHHGLKAVDVLRRGRCGVRESEPVKPVPDAFVDAIRPHVSRQVWAMIQLQRLTGMRPGEVVIIRTIDIDTSGRVWIYTSESHKTEHHDRERKIYIGPQAQTILEPWLRPELTAYLFSPREAEAERRAEQRRNRKTPVQPSQRDRRRHRPKKLPGEQYTSLTYCQAITRGIAKANREAERVGGDPILHWHPNQLRHNAATRLQKEFGLDVARVILGHTSPVVTEVYAEIDVIKGMDAMAKIG